MRAPSPLLIAFAAIAFAAAGCSGGTGPGLPPASNLPANSVTAASADAGAAATHGCTAKQGCTATLIMPLQFERGRFVTSKHAACNAVFGAAKPYVARRSEVFTLAGAVTLKPDCVPAKQPKTRLYIAAAEVGATHAHAANAIDVGDGARKASFVPLAGPVNWNDKQWTFSPFSLGIPMQARAKYVFYVVSVPLVGSPSPGSTPGPNSNFVLLQPLSFDGTNFTETATTCDQSNPGDATPYVAPTTGPLALAGSVTLTPSCVPPVIPPNAPQLYIVAVDLSNGGGWGGDATSVQRQRHQNVLAHPMDYAWGIPATPVAGGVTITSNPWVFAPDSPGLAMTGGTSYAFFIAAPVAPPPPQAQSYREVVPLNFDGTNFTLPAITDCTNLPAATPYTAPTSAPLTLAGNVSIAPTCAPASGGSGPGSGSGDAKRRIQPADHHGGSPGDGPSGSGQLYIIAVAPCSSSGSGSDNGSGSASNPCGGSGSTGSGDDWASGSNGCGPSGGSGSASNDGSASGPGCAVNGIAIAGPVNVTDNPWSFAPIVPAVQLIGGTQYTFHVAVANHDDEGGGDDNARHR